MLGATALPQPPRLLTNSAKLSYPLHQALFKKIRKIKGEQLMEYTHTLVKPSLRDFVIVLIFIAGIKCFSNFPEKAYYAYLMLKI